MEYEKTEEKTMGIKIKKSIYTLSKPLPNSLKNATNEEVIEYINDNYLIRKDFTKDEVKNDLIAFKYCRNNLGRNFKNGEISLSFLAMLISVLALLLTASLAQVKSNDLKLITNLILFAAAVYVIMVFCSLLKIFSKKKGSGKLVALQYGIDVLEMKKEEIDAKK